MYDLKTGKYCEGIPCSETYSWLLEYIGKCKSKEIIIGHELMMELDRCLECFNDPNTKIEFEDAHKRIKFIETKCKHFESPFAGKPFILELFQKAFIEAIYIFKIFDDEIGRYVRLIQDVLFLVGRKNGKTPLIAAINLAEFFCGPIGIKILCSSNDYEQADLMFQAINNMREESKELEKVTRNTIRKGIVFGNPKHIKKKGKFSYQNKGCIKKISAKTGAKEGRNIAVGSVDEVHEMKDDSSIMPIRQALSTQDEPLYFELTTEGTINDGYLDGRLKEARQVINGDLERPRWRVWIFSQDNEAEIWQDESSHVKSNPSLGVIKKKSFINKMLQEAQTNKKTRVFVLSKDFNIKQNNAQAWLTTQDIVNEEIFNIEDFRNCFGIGGVDLARTGDFASARMLLMRPGDKKKYILQQYFIPEAKLDKISKIERERYEEWIKQGYITVTEDSNENDFRLVTKWYVDLYKNYGIRPFVVMYDKWSATYWVNEMKDCGFDCEKVEQNHANLDNPMTMVEDDLKSKLLVYNNNPVDKFCFENTAINVNSKEQMMPMKVQGKEEKKIDGAATTIMCYKGYNEHKLEYLRLVG